MDYSKKRILEALRMQPLSDEEKASRHILGRLYGPIATCKEKTRNGRGYNRDLWEKALSDEVFKEKVANKSLFLELGHPVDREETDMEKVCACIPELPCIVDDDLYAYVDILDTKNGQLLKTLCDYGFVPGISSRGSGDVMADDNVDPETFFLETWDIVQLPAVKKARLAMCESVDEKALQLKAVLTESYNNANSEEKALMKEALDNLNIKLEEGKKRPTLSIDDLPIVEPESDEVIDILLEEDDEDAEFVEDEEVDVDVEESESDDAEEASEEDVEDDTDEVGEVSTISELIDSLSEYKDMEFGFAPVQIDGKEYEVSDLDVTVSGEDENRVDISVNLTAVTPETDDDKDELPEDESSEDDIETAADETADEESEVADEEVIDDESERVMDSFKEAVRQKTALEKEVKDLKQSKAVSDAEVENLKESVERYKSAFARVSELASKSKKFEAENKQLAEQIQTKNSEIKELKADKQSAKKLTESFAEKEAKVKNLAENLSIARKEMTEEVEKLNASIRNYKQKLNECVKIANSYKAKYQEALNKVITDKASMLGVKPSEITRQLDEQYTYSDIEAVCDKILTSARQSNLPFGGISANARVKINESVQQQKDPAYGYDIDDDLLTLAGLK